MTAREARRERLERAAEQLGELEQALDETRLALQQQLAENSSLVQQNADLRALLDSKQTETAERRTLLASIDQATSRLKEIS
jgi:regulator of replication initiation timing